MCKSNTQSIPVGTVVKFKIWETGKDSQGIGVILEQQKDSKYRVHFKKFPELIYRINDPFELTISQSDITEVLDTGARVCDVTSQPMNDGWVWGDGVFYAKNLSDTLKECREDRDSILTDIDSVDSSDLINDSDRYDEFKLAIDKASRNEDTDEDLLMIAFQTDYLYYTEWELDDSVVNGDGWFVLDGETINIFDIFNFPLVRNAFADIMEASDPMGYDDELTSERLEEIEDTQGEEVKCVNCGNVNTHDTDDFGFCKECLELIV